MQRLEKKNARAGKKKKKKKKNVRDGKKNARFGGKKKKKEKKNNNKKQLTQSLSWEFYSPVKIVIVMLNQSVNLLTFFLGRLSSLSS